MSTGNKTLQVVSTVIGSLTVVRLKQRCQLFFKLSIQILSNSSSILTMLFLVHSYNVSKSTEKLVDLYDAYRQRYVGCETASFVTANSPSKYSYQRKERRKHLGRSPRRPQRRKIFSSSALKEACKTNSFGVSKKTILMTW